MDDYFVLHLGPRIRAKARQLLWMPGLAEDACQETILRVLQYFRSGKQLENPSSLAAFVFSVCHNVVLEMNRKVQPQIPETWEAPGADPNPHDVAVTEERKRLVWKILAKLRQRDRDLLIAVLQERDKDEVCRQFRVDRDYLRVLMNRARAAFRKELEKLEHAGTPRTRACCPPFDERYITGLRDGDPGVAAHFIAYFGRPIRAKARRQLRAPDLVEEVCQETMLRVLQYLRSGKRLDHPSRLPALVLSVLHNAIREVHRPLGRVGDLFHCEDK